MLREIDLSEISDGKLYTANDMVRIECQECKGCSACCHDMGCLSYNWDKLEETQ